MNTRKLKRIVDFLPPPSELTKPRVLEKVTFSLNLETFEFFKKQADKHRTQYQRMIREVLNEYKARYEAA